MAVRRLGRCRPSLATRPIPLSITVTRVSGYGGWGQAGRRTTLRQGWSPRQDLYGPRRRARLRSHHPRRPCTGALPRPPGLWRSPAPRRQYTREPNEGWASDRRPSRGCRPPADIGADGRGPSRPEPELSATARRLNAMRLAAPERLLVDDRWSPPAVPKLSRQPRKHLFLEEP